MQPVHFERISGTLLGKRLQVATFALGLLGLLSANPLLTVASLFLLLLLIKLLWRPGEPPILLFAMAYHWMQGSILILSANLQGLELNEMGLSQGAELATWLTLLGTLMVALGIRLGAGRNWGLLRQKIAAGPSPKLDLTRLFPASLAAIVFANVISSFSLLEPGLRQVFLAVAGLHWVVIFVYAFTVLNERRGYGGLALVFGIELVVGFLGFFSGFRDVLVIMLLAVLTAPLALRGVRLRTVVSLSMAIVVLGILWTAIKQDYRSFLNRGTGDQVVLVPVRDRLEKLSSLMLDLTWTQVEESTDALVRRLGYIQQFGETLQTVPAILPHENGKLWAEALKNPLQPRLLNPNKRVFDDSIRTARYTRAFVAGAAEGTSIGLGYVAESYIDFGPILMMLPLFLWGVAVGAVHRVFLQSAPFPLWGFGSSVVVIYFSAAMLETSNAKMVGGLVLWFLVFFLVQFFLSKRIQSFFAGPAAQATPA